MRGASNDMCSIELQPKSSQKLNKTKVLLCKYANVPIVRNVSLNENLHNTKVVDLEKLCKSGIQHFSI